MGFEGGPRAPRFAHHDCSVPIELFGNTSTIFLLTSISSSSLTFLCFGRFVCILVWIFGRFVLWIIHLNESNIKIRKLWPKSWKRLLRKKKYQIAWIFFFGSNFSSHKLFFSFNPHFYVKYRQFSTKINLVQIHPNGIVETGEKVKRWRKLQFETFLLFICNFYWESVISY